MMLGFCACFKRSLWVTVGLVAPSALAITPGNLVVVRVGDGSVLLSGASAPVFLQEYTTAGAQVSTLNLPTAAAGGNRACTLSGNVTTEGYLNQSIDGQFLVLGGYDTAPGFGNVATTNSGSINRVVARVSMNGTINTSTAMNNAFSGSNIRGVASDNGLRFWSSGAGSPMSGGGVWLANFGANSATQITVNSGGSTNLRVVNINAGQLYVSSSSGQFLGVSRVGMGLPTTGGQPVALMAGFFSGTHSAMDFFFANPNTLYIADDGINFDGGGIQKWIFNGSTWNLMYILNDGANPVGMRGLTGYINTAGNAVLFSTSSQPQGNRIFTVTDTGPGSILVQIAQANFDTAFRGIRYILRTPCPGDTFPFVGNNDVNIDDLLVVINDWGTCDQPCPPYCPGDVDHNCLVDIDDLLAVINNWGPCR